MACALKAHNGQPLVGSNPILTAVLTRARRAAQQCVGIGPTRSPGSLEHRAGPGPGARAARSVGLRSRTRHPVTRHPRASRARTIPPVDFAASPTPRVTLDGAGDAPRRVRRVVEHDDSDVSSGPAKRLQLGERHQGAPVSQDDNRGHVPGQGGADASGKRESQRAEPERRKEPPGSIDVQGPCGECRELAQVDDELSIRGEHTVEHSQEVSWVYAGGVAPVGYSLAFRATPTSAGRSAPAFREDGSTDSIAVRRVAVARASPGKATVTGR